MSMTSSTPSSTRARAVRRLRHCQQCRDGSSVGTDHDTASFAVNAIRRWWRTMGQEIPSQGLAADESDDRRRRQQRLSRDACGRSSLRNWLMSSSGPSRSDQSAARHQQVEQDRASPVLVHHHKLARASRCAAHRTIVQLIAATTTDAGLKVCAELDERKYPKAVKISDATTCRRQYLSSRIPRRLELHRSIPNKPKQSRPRKTCMT